MSLRRRNLVRSLATALASGALLATALPLLADTPTNPNPPSPVFIVCARTDIADQGAPTLDILDFEHYVTQQLTAKGMQDVSPSATTKVADAISADAYLLDVDVQTMRVANRSTFNEAWHRYEEHGIFEVELLLTVKNLKSGRVIGASIPERHDQWFVTSDASEQLAEKRAALSAAADNLAGRFFAELQDGRFGPELSFPRPPSTEEQIFTDIKGLFSQPQLLQALRLVALVLGGVLSIACLKALKREISQMAHRRAVLREQAVGVLNHALALQLKTNDFSDDACRSAASARREQILAAHSEIERKAAEQVREARAFEEGYAQIAKLGGKEAAFDKRRLVEVLSRAHEWEFRVLQEAKRQAAEADE